MPNTGYNTDGHKSDGVTGIPFFITTKKFFGYTEPFVRIILDKAKLLKDGYTLFNPGRDEGERRIKETIKDWKQYLISIEINRDEFDLPYDPEWDEWEREMPLPFNMRKKWWDMIVREFPENKMAILSDRWFADNTLT